MGSFDDYSYSPAAAAREMCMEIGGGRGRRGGGGGGRTADGGKTATKQKQPQRGLGVAQLEKIRLHNQMLAAYRSATAAQHHQLHDDAAASTTAMMHPLVPPPPPAAAVAPGGGGSSFQPYHHHVTNRCFEETDHHRHGAVHYYDGLLPYSRTATPTSPPTPSLYAHDVRDSSGHRLGQPPQQHYWMMSSRSDGASAEELDLELRL